MNTRTQVHAVRSRFPSLAILVSLAMLSCSTFAAPPPNPPVFTSIDGRDVDHPAPHGNYSLEDAIRGLPFTVNTPTPPQGELIEVNVTPATFSANNVNGRRLILAAGNYGNIALNRSDQEIVITTGVVINVLTINATRLILRASPARSGTISTFHINNTSDALFDGINTDSASGSGNRNELFGCDRVAFINSRIRAEDFSLGSFPQTSYSPTDLIVANNELISFNNAQSNVRLQSVLRLVFVDNRVHEVLTHANFRLHTTPNGQKSDFLYVSRNQFEGPHHLILPVGGTAGPGAGMGTLWFESNDIYYNGFWFAKTSEAAPNTAGSYADAIIYRNNNAYISSGGFPTGSGLSWDATFENNTVHAYVSPPAWEYQ